MGAEELPGIAVPDLDAPWSEIWEFALTYDAFGRHGGFTGAAQIGNAVHDQWAHGRRLPDDLSTLRAALSFQQRRFEHFGVNPQGDDARFVLALLAKVRTLTGGVLSADIDAPSPATPSPPWPAASRRPVRPAESTSA